MIQMRQAVLICFFGRRRDRFSECGADLNLEEKLELARSIPHVRGVEVVYPNEGQDPVRLARLCSSLDLEIAAINVNLKGHPAFCRGAITSDCPEVLQLAFKLMIEAKQFASECGCARVTCAPLADGSDYSFQASYSGTWDSAVRLVSRAVRSEPNVLIHFEHKPSDPRVRGFLRTVETAALFARETGSGITLNSGHASAGTGSPAESVRFLADCDIPMYVHFCAATSGWDWDLLSGSTDPWGFIEFLGELKAVGYDGWITADTFPLRLGAVELFAANAQRTKRWAEMMPVKPLWSSS